MTRGSDRRARATADFLQLIQDLLDAGHAEDALDLFDDGDLQNPLLADARAVCLLRVGRVAEALAALRALALVAGTSALDRSLPPTIHTNYATALLLAGEVRAACSVLRDLALDAHPTVVKLRAAIVSWHRARGLWGRLGLRARPPVELAFPPGELTPPTSGRPRRAA